MNVTLSTNQGIATVTIDRPDRLNALDEPTRIELCEALETSLASSSVDVIVLTGSGRAFCVGQDLAASVELLDAEATVRTTYNPIVSLLAEAKKPVIAAVNGPAVGAGMGLALACDAVVMSESAFMSCSFSRVALVPDTSCTLEMVRQVGYRRAFELAVSARKIEPEEALALGFATQIATNDEFADAVLVLASSFQTVSSNALMLTKRLMRSVDAHSLQQSLDLEAVLQGQAASHQHHAEGVIAFTERRPARFVG